MYATVCMFSRIFLSLAFSRYLWCDYLYLQGRVQVCG